MIPLSDPLAYVIMLVVAAVVGAIGGFAAELMQSRQEKSGTLEVPEHRDTIKAGGLWDLGWYATVFLGAVSAVAAITFFPVEVMRDVQANGITLSIPHYELVRLVGLSLIVGSAGGAFLTSMQARILAVLNAQKAETILRVANQEIKNLGETANNALQPEIEAAIRRHLTELLPTLVPTASDDIGTRSLYESAPMDTKVMDSLVSTIASDVQAQTGTRTTEQVNRALTNIAAAAG